MATQEVTLVNDQVVKLFEQMEPRHVALMISKILNPDLSLTELSKELWPTLAADTRRKIVMGSNVNKLIPMVKDRPWVLAAIMAHKLAPLAVAALYEMMMTANKENVRVTAAKEVVRLAQSTFTKMQPSAEEPVPTEEQDEFLGQYTRDDEEHEDTFGDSEEQPEKVAAEVLLLGREANQT